MPQAKSTRPQLPTVHNSWTMFAGGLIAFGILAGVSLLLGKLDPSGLSGVLLIPFFLGAGGAILFGGIALLVIGIKKVARG